VLGAVFPTDGHVNPFHSISLWIMRQSGYDTKHGHKWCLRLFYLVILPSNNSNVVSMPSNAPTVQLQPWHGQNL